MCKRNPARHFLCYFSYSLLLVFDRIAHKHMSLDVSSGLLAYFSCHNSCIVCMQKLKKGSHWSSGHTSEKMFKNVKRLEIDKRYGNWILFFFSFCYFLYSVRFWIRHFAQRFITIFLFEFSIFSTESFKFLNSAFCVCRFLFHFLLLSLNILQFRSHIWLHHVSLMKIVLKVLEFNFLLFLFRAEEINEMEFFGI